MEHPVTGERVVWRSVAEDTGGDLLELELFAQPGGFVAAAHVHPKQEERFEVISGTLALVVDGEERTLRPGDVAVVPRGRPHAWWNAGPDEVRIKGEIRPALRTEHFFETFFGLGKDGGPLPGPNPEEFGLGGRGQTDPLGNCRGGEDGAAGVPGTAGAGGRGGIGATPPRRTVLSSKL